MNNQKPLKITFLIIAILIIILIPFLIFTSAQPKQLLQPQTKVITQTTQSQVTGGYTQPIMKQPVIQKNVVKHYYNYYLRYYKPRYQYKYKIPRCYKDSDCNIDCPQMVGQDTPRCSLDGKCYCGSGYTKPYKSFRAPTKKTYTPPTRYYHKPENRPIQYYPIDL